MIDFNLMRDPQTGEDTLEVPVTGPWLLMCPLFNKGTAFTEEERSELGVRGLVPAHVNRIDDQVVRCYQAYQQKPTDLERHIYLRALQDRNETLFYRQLVQGNLRVRARPVLRNGPGFAVPILVDTGQLPGSRQYTIGPEFAMVLGSVTIQAEWTGQALTDAVESNQPQGTVFFHGGYVEALYFLTGEYQEYEKKEGVFGRVVPNNGTTSPQLKRCLRSVIFPRPRGPSLSTCAGD